MGSRETGKKPVTMRRRDSQTDGAFGRETEESLRAGDELNRKIAGQPSQQHLKYTKAKKQNG